MNEPITISEYTSHLIEYLEVLSTHTKDLSEFENEKKIDAMTEVISNLIEINKGTLAILESVTRRYN